MIGGPRVQSLLAATPSFSQLAAPVIAAQAKPSTVRLVKATTTPRKNYAQLHEIAFRFRETQSALRIQKPSPRRGLL